MTLTEQRRIADDDVLPLPVILGSCFFPANTPYHAFIATLEDLCSGGLHQLTKAAPDVLETLVYCRAFIRGNWSRLPGSSPRLLLDRLESAIAAMQEQQNSGILEQTAIAGESSSAAIAPEAVTEIVSPASPVPDQPVRWESFCDLAYFERWCVRRVGETKFGEGFHLASQPEAVGLCHLLNSLGGVPEQKPGALTEEEKREAVGVIADATYVRRAGANAALEALLERFTIARKP